MPSPLTEVRNFLLDCGGLIPVETRLEKCSLHMLEQGSLGRWDVFQHSASSGEEVIPGFVDTGCNTVIAVHDYDEAFYPLHVHGLETE